MLIDVPVRGHPELIPQFATSDCTSLNNLVQRLSTEVEIAEDRVLSLQTAATDVYVGQEQRLMRFETMAEKLHAILLPRLQAFMNLKVFTEIKQNVSVELRGVEGQGFHGRTTTLTVLDSDNRSTPMEFSFHVGHDDSMKNIIMDYRLEILPIFIKFDSYDALVIPVDDPNEELISSWIDDKLVGFTRTYFEVYYHDEYQKKYLVLDPVMNVLFPKTFAVGHEDYQGHTYYFYINASLQKFQTRPSEYVATQ